MQKQSHPNQHSLVLLYSYDPIRCYHFRQGGPGSDSNDGMLRIPQSSSITGTAPSDYLLSYAGHSFGVDIPLQRFSHCILQPQPTSQTVSWYFHSVLLLIPVYLYVYDVYFLHDNLHVTRKR